MDHLAALADTPARDGDREGAVEHEHSKGGSLARLCFAFIDAINQSVSEALSASSLTT